MTRQDKFFRIDPPEPCVVTPLQTVIHGINDIGDMAGRCFDASGKELAWIWWRDGRFQTVDHPDLPSTDAWLLTNNGQVVGDYRDASLFVHGYTWTETDGLVTLDFPGMQTGVRSMNERGDITGIYQDVQGRLHGFILREGVFNTIDYPGAVNGGGTLVINDRGLIVGGFLDAGGEHGFIALRDVRSLR